MKVAITGASGFLGSALTARLKQDGANVVRLVRGQAGGPDQAAWSPLEGKVDTGPLAGADAVVHLAGSNIAAGRWTATRKASIRDSRVVGTRTLVQALRKMEPPPKVLVSASAVGFYGNRGNEELKEGMFGGGSFLADVATDWEKAALAAQSPKMRVVCPRFGMILHASGGALSRMLLPFKLGLGGKLGGGRQWMPWVSLTDALGAIRFAIGSDQLSGPVNVVGPTPVTNAEFTRALGKVLHRPTFATVPEFALVMLLGEMAEELLFYSQKVMPVELQKHGYQFEHRTVEDALKAALA
jgi:uncharacterized protein (TIGR01777 family)